MERKLAAILAADVAGYSRLMEADEEGTLAALRGHREIVDGMIAAHRGRVFNTAGDSVIAEFASAVEATLCAVEIQQEIGRRNEAVPKDKRLEFRIGINIGDVMVEGGNLFGDGVNVADRVQKLAEPGGICIARNVQDHLRNKADLTIEPMGEHQVKNIATPVSVYRVLLPGAARRPLHRRWAAALRAAPAARRGGGAAPADRGRRARGLAAARCQAAADRLSVAGRAAVPGFQRRRGARALRRRLLRRPHHPAVPLPQPHGGVPQCELRL